MNGECSVCGLSACPPPGPRERARRASLSPTSERWHAWPSPAPGEHHRSHQRSAGQHISVTSSGTATVRSLPFGAPSGSPAEALVVSQARLNDRALLPPGSTHDNLTHKSAAPEGTAPRLILLAAGHSALGRREGSVAVAAPPIRNWSGAWRARPCAGVHEGPCSAGARFAETVS